MSLGHAVLRQCGRPTGWIGRLTLWRMNRRHSKVTAWGLSEHGALLSTAGYSGIRILEEYEKGWLCATGQNGQ